MKKKPLHMAAHSLNALDIHIRHLVMKNSSRWDPTSSPGPSPCSKWRSEKPLAKAAEILQESGSILSRDTWSNGVFEVCFQRLAALFVFCNWKALFKQNEDISSYLRDEILTNFWSHFGSLGQGFLRPPFWTRRRPWGRGWVRSNFFLRPLQDGSRLTFLTEKRKPLFTQIKYWLDLNPFSFPSTNLHLYLTRLETFTSCHLALCERLVVF